MRGRVIISACMGGWMVNIHDDLLTKDNTTACGGGRGCGGGHTMRV